MKHFFSILILTQLSFQCFGQKTDWVYTSHGVTKKLPMINAIGASGEYYGHACIDPYTPLTFSSCSDSVFSLVDGKVVAVFSLDDQISILIKDSLKRFYSYTSLKSSFVVKGQEIKKGDWVGVAMKNDGNSMFEIMLMIYDGKARGFEGKKVWAMIRRQDE